jgi:uncharacterized delta-60 repeat protein
VWVWAAVKLGWLTLPILAFFTPGQGLLDPGFGESGAVRDDRAGGSDSALAMVLEPDGGVTVAGKTAGPGGDDFVLARYDSTGALDQGFGAGGYVTFDVAGGDDAAFALARQPDGGLLAAGYTAPGRPGDLAIARFNADGSRDAAFGEDGRFLFDVAGDADILSAVAVQPDGRILAAGSAIGDGSRGVVIRLTADGALDPTFGEGGLVRTGPPGGHTELFALALRAGGRIVVAGRTVVEGDVFFLAALEADGSPDRSFGDGGVVITDLAGSSDSAFGLGLLADGRIIAAGGTLVGGEDLVAVARYDATGRLDPSFGEGGAATFDVAPGSDEAFALTLQPDGAIVLAGGAITEAGEDAFMARVTSAGRLDAGFAEGGVFVFDAGGGIHELRAVALQGDGRITAAGRTAAPASPSDLLLLQLAAR